LLYWLIVLKIFLRVCDFPHIKWESQFKIMGVLSKNRTKKGEGRVGGGGPLGEDYEEFVYLGSFDLIVSNFVFVRE